MQRAPTAVRDRFGRGLLNWVSSAASVPTGECGWLVGTSVKGEGTPPAGGYFFQKAVMSECAYQRGGRSRWGESCISHKSLSHQSSVISPFGRVMQARRRRFVGGPSCLLWLPVGQPAVAGHQ